MAQNVAVVTNAANQFLILKYCIYIERKKIVKQNQENSFHFFHFE